jgi:2-methylcitrate dehydratase PrpD
MTITEKWADFIAACTFDELPAEVVQQTKNFILDNIGCALGGYAIEWGKKVAALGRDFGGKPEATVIGGGERLHCTCAAYVNGKLGNILDMDETLYNNRHIGGVPFFPALSAAERVGATGKDVILATALAYDFAARSGVCGSSFRPDPEKGVVISGNAAMGFNTFAAAVAAGKVFRFDREQMVNTLGVVGYLAPGAIESKFTFTPPGNFNKYGDMGWFCFGGIMATLCVENGYIGDPSILDGPRGLAALLGAPEFDYETFVAGIGERWYIMDAGFKLYPTCRWFHTGIWLLQDIIVEHELKPEDIDRIIVSTHPLAVNLPMFVTAAKWAGSPGKELWLSVDSISYALACAVYGITPGPEWCREETLTSPEIIEMTKKIVHREHPDGLKQSAAWTGHPGKIFSQPPTSIEVISRKGTFTAGSNDIPGDSWNPRTKLADDEITGKFRTNASYVLDDTQINGIIDVVGRLEKTENIGELTSLLAPQASGAYGPVE